MRRRPRPAHALTTNARYQRGLLIVDRNFLDYGLLFGLSHDYSTGEVNGDKHWLIRTKKNTRAAVGEALQTPREDQDERLQAKPRSPSAKDRGVKGEGA